MSVTITAATQLAINTHAERTYPDECCGFVVARDGREEVLEIENVQNELHAKDPQSFTRDARTAYNMRYADVEPIFEAAYKGTLRLRAVYHSHPEHDAYFSDTDRAAAEGWIDDPNYAAAGQIVVSVRQRRAVVAKAFVFDPTSRQYVDAALNVE